MSRGRIDHYSISESIATRDSVPVLLGLNAQTNRPCTLKVLLHAGQSAALFQFRQAKLRLEFERQSMLSEQFVWPARAFSPSSTFIDSLGQATPAAYLELDLCEQGSFFDIQAAFNKPMSETLARTYFHQLISALFHCSFAHIVHWNVMSESLLVNGRDMSIRLADFRTAETVDRRRQMSAPEVAAGAEICGAAVDVFACGFALFSWVYLEVPFEKADTANSRYRQLLEGNSKFWARSRFKKEEISDNLKELLSSMMALDPTQRPTLSEIKAHPWYSGPVYSQEELKSKVMRKIQKSTEMRTIKPASLSNRFAPKDKQGLFRSLSEGQSSEMSLSPPKGEQASLPLYVPSQWSFSQLFLYMNPEFAWDCALKTLSQSLYAKSVRKLEAYKAQVHTANQAVELAFTMRLLDCSQGLICLDFALAEGNAFDFLYTFQYFALAAEKWLD